MKKKYIILFFLISNLFFINAQVVDVITGLSNPVGLAIHNNDLYIGEVGNIRVLKIDITDNNPTPQEFINLSGIGLPTLFSISNDILYIPHSGGIMYTDLTQATVTTNNITIPVLTFGSAISGNDLYVSIRTTAKIVKVDPLQTNPIATDYINLGTSPNAIVLNGNDLYVSLPGNDKISKIDITTTIPTLTDVVTGVDSVDLLIVGNYLYFSSSNNVLRIDITQANPSVEQVVTNLSGDIFGIAISNGILYMAIQNQGKVVKFDTSTLSLENHQNKQKLTLYPNPAKDYFYIEGLLTPSLKYSIMDIYGRFIVQNEISSNNKIDIKDLKAGVYFVKVKNDKLHKIIKH